MAELPPHPPVTIGFRSLGSTPCERMCPVIQDEIQDRLARTKQLDELKSELERGFTLDKLNEWQARFKETLILSGKLKNLNSNDFELAMGIAEERGLALYKEWIECGIKTKIAEIETALQKGAHAIQERTKGCDGPINLVTGNLAVRLCASPLPRMGTENASIRETVEVCSVPEDYQI